MKLLRDLLVSLALLMAGLVSFQPEPAEAQGQPCQWQYSNVVNVATATYCGNVQIAGQVITPPLNTFPTMASLTALTAAQMTTTSLANLEGFYAGSTAGGGQFLWVPSTFSSSWTPDGGVILAPSDHPGTCTSGCMIRQLNGNAATFEDFGAHGDGVTDDTSALNTAIASVALNLLKIDESLVTPNGAALTLRTYLVSAPINMSSNTANGGPWNGLQIRGAGTSFTQIECVFAAGHAAQPCVDVSGISYSHVSDLAIVNGTSSANPGAAAALFGSVMNGATYIQSVQNSWQRVRFDSFGKYGIVHFGDEAWTCDNCTERTFNHQTGGADIVITGNGAQTSLVASPFQTQPTNIQSVSDYGWTGRSNLILSEQPSMIFFHMTTPGDIDSIYFEGDMGAVGPAGAQSLFNDDTAGLAGTIISNVSYTGDFEVSTSTAVLATMQASVMVGLNFQGVMRSATSGAPSLSANLIQVTNIANCHLRFDPGGIHSFSGHLYTISGPGWCDSTWTPVEFKTVANLNSNYPCNAGAWGARYWVSDASSPAFNTTLVGGGTTHILAVCNQFNWVPY